MAIRHRKVNGRDRWDVRLRGPDGRQSSTTFDTKAEADRFETFQKQSLYEQRYVHPTDTKVTLAKVAGDWLRSDPSKRPRSLERDRIALERWIFPSLGARSVGSIKRADVQAAVNSWAQHLEASTVKRTYSTLRAVLAFAVDEQILVQSPARKIKLPAEAQGDERALTRDEVRSIIGATDEFFRAMVTLAADTGLRLGELLGLRIRSIDVDRGVLHVTEQLYPDGVTYARLKSNAGRRHLRLAEGTLEVMRSHLDTRSGAAPDAPLFVGKRGGSIGHSNFRVRVWQPAVKAAGCAWATPHDLRDFAATELVAANTPFKTTQARMGHANVRTTLAIYAKARPEDDAETAERIGSVASQPTADKPDPEPAAANVIDLSARRSLRSRPA